MNHIDKIGGAHIYLHSNISFIEPRTFNIIIFQKRRENISVRVKLIYYWQQF